MIGLAELGDMLLVAPHPFIQFYIAMMKRKDDRVTFAAAKRDSFHVLEHSSLRK